MGYRLWQDPGPENPYPKKEERMNRLHRAALAAALALGGASSALAQNPYQSSNDNYGVSGGNVNDHSTAFCCSGTLGSLVSGGGSLYILSNNHVLARSGQAAGGEDISQPGLIDNGCGIAEVVADFTAAPALGSNVDAAVAALRAGGMNTTGAIEGIGTISSVVKAAAVGLSVTKSGRTTGTTTGTVSSVNTSVNVQYQKGCGKGKKFTVSYTNQVVITPGSFSAGGDSGSLILSNNSCHQPVALLYAGSSSTTIGNPIGEVLTKVGTALGSSVSFVGGSCSAMVEPAGDEWVADDQLEYATNVKERHAARLMADAAVMAVGVGADAADTGRAAIVIILEEGRAHAPLPSELDGVRVRVLRSDPIRAYGWNEAERAEACSR
jgi:hypothetical protein